MRTEFVQRTLLRGQPSSTSHHGAVGGRSVESVCHSGSGYPVLVEEILRDSSKRSRRGRLDEQQRQILPRVAFVVAPAFPQRLLE